jgi:hypothetical protein
MMLIPDDPISIGVHLRRLRISSDYFPAGRRASSFAGIAAGSGGTKCDPLHV